MEEERARDLTLAEENKERRRKNSLFSFFFFLKDYWSSKERIEPSLLGKREGERKESEERRCLFRCPRGVTPNGQRARKLERLFSRAREKVSSFFF